MKVNDDAPQFARRLTELLRAKGQKRHGAGAYLANKYKVAAVTANAWLNGEYKPGIPIAERIAKDHGSTLDDLYFGGRLQAAKSPEPQDESRQLANAPARHAWPFHFRRERFDCLNSADKLRVEGAMLAVIIEIESRGGDRRQKKRA